MEGTTTNITFWSLHPLRLQKAGTWEIRNHALGGKASFSLNLEDVIYWEALCSGLTQSLKLNVHKLPI